MKNASKHFAELLYRSLLPKDVKRKILKNIKNISQKELHALYHVLKEEDVKKQKGTLKMELEAQKIMEKISEKGTE